MVRIPHICKCGNLKIDAVISKIFNQEKDDLHSRNVFDCMLTQSEYCASIAQRKEKDKEMRKMKGYIPSIITKIELFMAGVVALILWGVGGGILKFILKL